MPNVKNNQYEKVQALSFTRYLLVKKIMLLYFLFFRVAKIPICGEGLRENKFNKNIDKGEK